ncbi:MAG: branched-chain amino acid ABC transporter permease [Proteobacteria bacterium]|nr:branched-chain amino acid ABC transporter permease [Pseudomonadota bacterium]
MKIINYTGIGGLKGHSLSLALLFVVSLLPLWMGQYYLQVFTIAFYYVILASSWNLLAGYTGQFSLAHHAFAAIGGYTSALLVSNFGLPIWMGVLAAPLSSALMGFILGLLCLRMRAIYLAIATWAFAESVRITISMTYEITRGDLGLAVPKLFMGKGQGVAYYYLFLGLAVATVLMIIFIMRSKMGYYLRAIRNDEMVARVMGIDTTRWKILAFILSSGTAGIAGAFYGHYNGLLTPVMIDFNEMAFIVIMVVIGGIRSIAGPVIGAILIELLTETFREFGEIRMVVFALAVIAIARLYNEGAMGTVRQFTQWISRRKQAREGVN